VWEAPTHHGGHQREHSQAPPTPALIQQGARHLWLTAHVSLVVLVWSAHSLTLTHSLTYCACLLKHHFGLIERGPNIHFELEWAGLTVRKWSHALTGFNTAHPLLHIMAT
jgi:hypothetical protein